MKSQVVRGGSFLLLICSHCEYVYCGKNTTRTRSYARNHARDHSHVVVRFMVSWDVVRFVLPM